MKKSLLLFTLLVCSLAMNAQWQYEGSPNFSAGQASYFDLTVDGTTPYVAYRDQANSNRISVQYYDGSNWVYLGNPGFTPSGAQDISLDFYNGYAHVAFVDAATANGATVMAFDGSSWQNIGSAGFSPGGVSDVKLYFDGSVPYVAFADWTAGGAATVMRFMTGSWQIVGSAGFTAGTANDLSFTMIGSTPYVAYQDMAFSNQISVMYYNGSSWVYAGSQGVSGAAGDRTELTNDGTNVYLAYREQTMSQQATVRQFDGSSWTLLGSTGFTAGGTDYLSMACLNGTPYIGYKDDANSFRASVQKFDGSNWVNVGAAGFTSSQALYTSIDFSDTIPMIAFQDYNSGSYTASVMKYIPCIGPDAPSISLSATTICQGESFTLTVTGGNLNSATTWSVYAGGCTGSPVASDPSGPFIISPSGSATYYVRGEGGCVGFVPCISNQFVTVLPVDTNITYSAGILSVGNGDETAYQWLDCNNAFAPWIGDTLQTLVPSLNGSYAVAVTENGCTDTTSCISVANVSTELFEQENFVIFPNPSDGTIQLQSPDLKSGQQLIVSDQTGRVVHVETISGTGLYTVDLSNLKSGIYYLTLSGDGIRFLRVISIK